MTPEEPEEVKARIAADSKRRRTALNHTVTVRIRSLGKINILVNSTNSPIELEFKTTSVTARGILDYFHEYDTDINSRNRHHGCGRGLYPPILTCPAGAEEATKLFIASVQAQSPECDNTDITAFYYRLWTMTSDGKLDVFLQITYEDIGIVANYPVHSITVDDKTINCRKYLHPLDPTQYYLQPGNFSLMDAECRTTPIAVVAVEYKSKESLHSIITQARAYLTSHNYGNVSTVTHRLAKVGFNCKQGQKKAKSIMKEELAYRSDNRNVSISSLDYYIEISTTLLSLIVRRKKGRTIAIFDLAEPGVGNCYGNLNNSK